MSFDLPDSWVWDFWTADDGERYHLFFLYASRALHDPHARHYRASVGHAVSRDLVQWERVADALVRSDAPAPDDLATWTGSVIRDDDGAWVLFYTGATPAGEGSNIQTVCTATSADLMTWTKSETNPVLRAGAPYETLASEAWHDEAFRDPWVFRDPEGQGWHMLITARSDDGAPDDRGVVGHATSPDLTTWTLEPPLSAPGHGFGQLEVMQVEEIDGRHVLLFSCLAQDLGQSRRDTGTTGGVWAATAQGPLGPFDLSQAWLVCGSDYYSGRLVRRHEGDWVLLAFHHDGPDGAFVGGITDPRPVSWVDGRLEVTAPLPT